MSSVVAPSFVQELGGDVALLCGLRVVERLAGIFEIGAGILAVRIEEEVIEARIEVVVLRDIAPGAPPVVALVQAAKRQARLIQRLDPGQALQFGEVARAQLQDVVKAALGDDEAPVRVKFAEGQRRIENQPPFGRAIQKLHAEERPLSVAEGLDDAIGGLHFQAPLANQSP